MMTRREAITKIVRGPSHWSMRDHNLEPDLNVLSLQVKHSIMRLANYHGRDAAAHAIGEGIMGIQALEIDKEDE